MNQLGIHLTLMIGPDPVALFATPEMMQALAEVEVTHQDEGRSGFRLTFTIGRAGPFDLLNFGLVADPRLALNSRVVLIATFDAVPQVLMDGLVTRRDIAPGNQPGEGRLVLSGQDLGVAMQRTSTPTAHPAMDETAIGAFLALNYARYGMVPMVLPPPVIDPVVPVDRTPMQTTDDYSFLTALAERSGYVFYIEAGPAPMVNTLYFGPRVRPGIQQKALSVNLGPESNVSDINFANDALAPERVQARVQDRLTGQVVPVLTPVSTRMPLGLAPDYLRLGTAVRTSSMQTSGLSVTEAFGRAQARFDRSVDDSVVATGTLDPLRYNGLLRARAKVDLRGAGFTFDGTYVVRRVRHLISGGRYTQDFTISRHDTGPLLPLVRAA
ncbi:MAG: hypothetical protein BGP12_11580 [Rhodospirillales bacterium 70-18]|nr:hypothetical protein [Rhodospirillales bacterium]OJY68435.1 MAG: hypothetical protein BGP12_11580 [Rhodospirillales bacterium 70-18]